MNAENKFLLEKIRIMAKQVENNLKKKEEIKEKEKENEKKNLLMNLLDKE